MNQDEKRADELFFFSRDWLLLRELAPDAQAAPRHRLAWELLAGLRERSPAAGRLRRAGALLGHVDALECSGQNRAAQALWALLQHEWRWVQHSARTRRYLKARAAALGIANADAEIKAVQSAITAELLPLLHLKALLPKSAKEGEHHLRFLHTWRLGASASTAFVAIYDKYLRELTRLGRIPGPDVGENVAALLQTQDHQSLQYQGLLASYCALMKSVLDHVPPANRIEDLVRGFAQVQQAAPPRSDLLTLRLRGELLLSAMKLNLQVQADQGVHHLARARIYAPADAKVEDASNALHAELAALQKLPRRKRLYLPLPMTALRRLLRAAGTSLLWALAILVLGSLLNELAAIAACFVLYLAYTRRFWRATGITLLVAFIYAAAGDYSIPGGTGIGMLILFVILFRRPLKRPGLRAGQLVERLRSGLDSAAVWTDGPESIALAEYRDAAMLSDAPERSETSPDQAAAVRHQALVGRRLSRLSLLQTWLLTPYEWGAKTLAAAGLVMLVGSGQSLAHRHIALPARAASYEALQHAVGAGDDAAIIDNAERLLSQIGKDNEDPRTMPAASVFSEAMLRQVLTLQQRGQREDAQQLLARYHQAAVRPPLSTLRRVPLIEQVQP